ncbi:RHS repeat domain-containing protein [Pseudochryseolinea flava]|uniref:YD repeat-containing protein n=1 Tax=Pseudochryseolinea flava TaxID=2059302 RepID=A0A364XZC7_9BACT|nr:RHS repeat domain-containing protein [Pseudochryseolinea flava]RAV99655.1 hypothetical protein DQQ10_18845 [Pseudochryseolinea flava]
MKFFNNTFLVLLFFLQYFFSHGQDLNLNMSVRPPSPEVSNLGKFQAVPVGLYTGIPKVSIPIHTLKGRFLSIPISLNYHAGGVRVEETASMVGLGWSLSAGGVVTRQTRGLPDDFGNMGYLRSSYKPSNFLGSSGSEMIAKIMDVLNKHLDLEPDIFSFNFDGYSGEFFFDEQGNYHLKSHQDIRIEMIIPNPEGLISGWVITTPDGDKYYFGQTIDGSRSAVENPIFTLLNGARNDPEPPGASSWYLLEIVNANQTDQISFFYKEYSSVTCSYGTETILNNVDGYSLCVNNHSTPLNFVESTGTHWLIDSISSVDGSIKFDKRISRLDYAGSKRLDDILIFDKDGKVSTSFKLSYSYFNASGNKVFTDCHIQEDEQMKRLKLESVTEIGREGNKKPPYIFEYNATSLPSRFSKSVDYWGFYNGRMNSTLVPAITLNIRGALSKFDGGDRIPDFNYGVAGTLTKIQYPTGGSEEFEFEQNIISPPPSSQIPSISIPVLQYIGDTGATTITDDLKIVDQRNGYVWLNYNFTNTPSCENRGCDLYFEIQGTGANSDFLFKDKMWSGTVKLLNGRYRVKIYNLLKDPLKPFNFERFEMRWNEVSEQNAVRAYGGGIRVKKITTRSNVGPPVVRKYEYNFDTGIPSGRITASPQYGYQQTKLEACGQCQMVVRTSSSNVPLATTQSAYVGYMFVKEIYGESGENGYAEMEFSFSPDDDVDAINYPFPPPNSFEVMRGDLLVKKVFSATGRLLRQEQNHYQTMMNPADLYFSNSYGFRIVSTPNGACFSRYSTTGVWKKLNVTTIKTFGQQSTLTDSTTFQYDHASFYVFPNREVRYESNGEVTTKRTNYPMDDAANFSWTMDATALAAKNAMVQKYMLSVPLEQRILKGNSIVHKSRQDYVVVNGKIFPKSEWLAENGGSYLLKTNFEKFDSFGNVKQFTPSTSYSETNIWSADGTELIASVKNAISDQIFFTGFESNGTEGDAKTGNRFHGGSSYTIPADKRPIGSNLLMTFWYFDGTWKFQAEIPYTATISVGGATRYDEIRVFPRDAQITTYAYSPRGEVISVTDLNNQTTYYTYDEFDRLLYIQDENKNFIKAFNYNYVEYRDK